MKLWRMAALTAALLPVLLFSSDHAAPTAWHIRGSLSEACSCAVPCTCNFGGQPSPHAYCYSMYSYKIREGHYGRVRLDGLKFGSADARFGRTAYLDASATAEQRAALLAIAGKVLDLEDTGQFYSGQSMSHIATLTVPITQEADGRGNHLKLGDDGEFRATYIIGLDGKTPVVVKNNTTWAIAEAVKGRTSFFRYHAGRNLFSFKDTNSNQGDFDYDSLAYEDERPAAACHASGK